MKISYTVSGIVLLEHDLSRIHSYYEAACTAKYIIENFGISNETTALQLGYDTRKLMEKYGYDENEAITEAIKSYSMERKSFL